MLRATFADVPDLVGLAAAHEQDPVAMRHAFTRDLSERDRPLFVAVIAGRLVAYGRTARFEPPAGAPAGVAPAGYYLAGLLVDAAHRRRRLGRALTLARLQWIFERADEAYYFTGARNQASIALHAQLGFVEMTRDFTFPGVTFEGGGVLGRLARP